MNQRHLHPARRQIKYSNPKDRQHRDIKLIRNVLCFGKDDPILYRFAHERSVPAESDYNVLYHSRGKTLKIAGLEEVETFADWQKKGYDTHSIVADPLFKDRTR